MEWGKHQFLKSPKAMKIDQGVHIVLSPVVWKWDKGWFCFYEVAGYLYCTYLPLWTPAKGVCSIMGSVVMYLSLLEGVEVVFLSRQTCFPRCT